MINVKNINYQKNKTYKNGKKQMYFFIFHKCKINFVRYQLAV